MQRDGLKGLCASLSVFLLDFVARGQEAQKGEPLLQKEKQNLREWQEEKKRVTALASSYMKLLVFHDGQRRVWALLTQNRTGDLRIASDYV